MQQKKQKHFWIFFQKPQEKRSSPDSIPRQIQWRKLTISKAKREKSLCSAGLKCWHIHRTSMITMRQKPALLRFMKIEIPWKLHWNGQKRPAVLWHWIFTGFLPLAVMTRAFMQKIRILMRHAFWLTAHRNVLRFIMIWTSLQKNSRRFVMQIFQYCGDLFTNQTEIGSGGVRRAPKQQRNYTNWCLNIIRRYTIWIICFGSGIAVWKKDTLVMHMLM